MLKQILWALGAGLVVAVLAACSSGANNAGGGSHNGASGGAPRSTATAAPAPRDFTPVIATAPSTAATPGATPRAVQALLGSPVSLPAPRTDLRVVASTSWAGAFAKAAGIGNVQLIAPANVQHPPDYDAKPSDIAKVAGADYVLYAGFEGFAPRIKDATGGQTQLVQVNLDNTPAVVHSEVLRLAGLFGTTPYAQAWLRLFDEYTGVLSMTLKQSIAGKRPVVVAHAFVAPWAAFAGLDVAGTFGPMPLTANQIADLAAKKPTLIFDNGHVPLGDPLAQATGAKLVELINFPGPDLDLLAVFREDTARIGQALGA